MLALLFLAGGAVVDLSSSDPILKVTHAVRAVRDVCSNPAFYMEPSGHLHKKLHVALNTYKNNDFLLKSVQLYAACPVVHTIHVIWSDQDATPPDWLYHAPQVRVSLRTDSSLMERFRPLEGIPDGAPVYSVDDDIRFPCSSLALALHKWYAHPTSMTGFFARKAAYRHRTQHAWVSYLYRPPASGLHADGTENGRVTSLHDFNWVPVVNKPEKGELPPPSLRAVPEACPGSNSSTELCVVAIVGINPLDNRASGFNIILTKAAIFDAAYLRRFWQAVPPHLLQLVKESRNGEDLVFSWMMARFATHPLVWISHPGTEQEEYDDGDVSWLMQFKYGERISQGQGHHEKRLKVTNVANVELAHDRPLPMSDVEVAVYPGCFVAAARLQSVLLEQLPKFW